MFIEKDDCVDRFFYTAIKTNYIPSILSVIDQPESIFMWLAFLFAWFGE